MKEYLPYFKRQSVLYAEDDKSTKEAVVGFLTPLFGEILLAENGAEALEIFKNRKVDFILSDVNMPVMNGLEMAKQIRVGDKTTPIIMLSAHTEVEYLLEAVELNLVKYIVKPFGLDDFLEALEKIYNESVSAKPIYKGALYDENSKIIIKDGQKFELTKKESLLLEFLMLKKGMLATYDELEYAAWRINDEITTNECLRALVKQLRKKLPEGSIKNVPGLGYKLAK